MAAETQSRNLDRFLDLLQYLAQQEEPQSVADLSRQLGVTRNTVSAMLSALQSRNMTERTEDGRYVLGYGIVSYASGYLQQYPFLFAAERGARELAAAIGRPVELLVYKQPLRCLRLYTTEGIFGATVGMCVHACTNASGRILLAAQTDEVIAADLAAEAIEPYTDRTLTAQQVLEQIPGWRKAEYAVEWGERYPGRGSAAVPIRSRSGRVIAAMTVFFDEPLADAQQEELINRMRLAAMRVSEALGSTGASML